MARQHKKEVRQCTQCGATWLGRCDFKPKTTMCRTCVTHVNRLLARVANKKRSTWLLRVCRTCKRTFQKRATTIQPTAKELTGSTTNAKGLFCSIPCKNEWYRGRSR